MELKISSKFNLRTIVVITFIITSLIISLSCQNNEEASKSITHSHETEKNKNHPISEIPEYHKNAWLCEDNKASKIDDITTPNNIESWNCYVNVTFEGNKVIVKSTGIPNHDFESTLGCCAKENDYTWVLPLNPVPAEVFTKTPERGPIAITVTGVPIFGPEEGPEGDAVALHFGYFEEDRQAIELGICGGHSGPGNMFHYHYDANCIHWHPAENAGETIMDWTTSKLDPSIHSPIIGFAFDGYPIYGPYGWDENKNVKEMKTSYKLKDGKNGYGGIDDWEYVEELGDLDECNGIETPTPEILNGIYHYISALQNGIGEIGFPYFLLCYKGTPEKSNFNAGQGEDTLPNGERRGPPPDRGRMGNNPPDLSPIASKLGITVEKLQNALGPPPPNFRKASEILGISEDELRNGNMNSQ
jgi:hypothetical protein